MTPSATEIEAIVRKVLSTLMASDMSVAGGGPSTAIAIDKPETTTELVLSNSLISTRDLNGRLKGMQTVRVPESAVITPAVRDLCGKPK